MRGSRGPANLKLVKGLVLEKRGGKSVELVSACGPCIRPTAAMATAGTTSPEAFEKSRARMLRAVLLGPCAGA